MRDMTQDEIFESPVYRAKFKAGGISRLELTNKIINTIHGIYKRVEKVYGKDKIHDDKIPNKLKELYKECMQKRKDYDARERVQTMKQQNKKNISSNVV